MKGLHKESAIHAPRSMMVFTCVLALALLLSASPVLAVKVYQGRDYAVTKDHLRRVQICDREWDGHDAYTKYQIGNSAGAYGWKYDTNGASDGCSRTIRYWNGIYKFKACEQIDFWPNPCSSYAYP